MDKKEECLELGGHCYEEDDVIVDTMPPIYHRRCKHCGWVQTRSTGNWHDDDWANNPGLIKEHNTRAYMMVREI